MQSTDAYFLLFRGLLRHLAEKGIINQDDATSVVSEALNFASDSKESENCRLLEQLEKLMFDSAPAPDAAPSNNRGRLDDED